jgi:hypothetical protein
MSVVKKIFKRTQTNVCTTETVAEAKKEDEVEEEKEEKKRKEPHTGLLYLEFGGAEP